MPKPSPAWEQDPRLQRVLALVAAIVAEPGITPEGLGQEVATRTGRAWSPATLRRDVRLLKNWGLLREGPQRKGYRLAGVQLSPAEGRQVAEALLAARQLLPVPEALLALLVPEGEGADWPPVVLLPLGPAPDGPLLGALVEAARRGATLSLASRQGQAPWEGLGVPLRVEWALSGPWLWVESQQGGGFHHHRIPLAELLSALPTRQPVRGRKRQRSALEKLRFAAGALQPLGPS